MSNNSRVNPMFVDSVGGMVNPLTEVWIQAIVPIPSNSTWDIKFTDGAGNLIYSANNNGFIPPCPVDAFKTTGLQCTAITNCTALIYCRNL